MVTGDLKMNSEFLQDKEIIVASNRGPVVFKRDDSKEKIELIRGAGGIVGSMIPFLKKLMEHGFRRQLENAITI